VWRSSDDAPAAVLLGLAREPSWLDADAVLGSKYSYWVQAMLPLGEQQTEGVPGEIFSVTYVDEFPPAAPRGLTVIAGLNGVELAWERNVEGDLAGYQIYRGLEDGPLAKLGAPVPLPSASDTSAEPGKRYRFAVAAIDTAGNLSQLCDPVEIVAPEKPK
jgi:fibronectin type 3 domain-containing protein